MWCAGGRWTVTIGAVDVIYAGAVRSAETGMVSFVNTAFAGFAKWAPPWAHGLVASTLIKKDPELIVGLVVEIPNKPREAALIILCHPDCGVGKAKGVNIK